jgi:hypothetical protein
MFHKKIPARKFASYVTEAELRAQEVKEQVNGQTAAIVADKVDLA